MRGAVSGKEPEPEVYISLLQSRERETDRAIDGKSYRRLYSISLTRGEGRGITPITGRRLPPSAFDREDLYFYVNEIMPDEQ